jgi:hypothetical protein
MKISRNSAAGEKVTFSDVGNAVDDACTASPWSYGDKRTDRIEADNDKLRQLVARLVVVLNLNKEQLKEVLGYGWEVEE